DNAMDVVNNALERVESAKIIEKRFVDLTFKAETTVRNGRKFGIDMKPAEAKLAQAVQLRKSDFAEATRSAEEAYRLAWEASGSVPLAIQIVSHRVFDDKEYTQEMIAQIDVSEIGAEKAKRLVADLETRCPICKGLIKKGFKVTRCGCGRDFHELCASRVGR